jgi:hypothetical protein
MLAAAPLVLSTSLSPSRGPSTETDVASASDKVPVGATTVTLLRRVNGAPVRGSMM